MRASGRREVRAGVRGPHRKNLRFFLWGGLANCFVRTPAVDAHVLMYAPPLGRGSFAHGVPPKVFRGVSHLNESVRGRGVGAEETSCSDVGIECARLLTWEYCLPPSCGFPPKSFPLKRGPTISGDTFGTRARGRPRSAPLRRRHVMPLAMRPLREESGALPAHFTSALGTHTVAAALKRASPCERLVSGSTPN